MSNLLPLLSASVELAKLRKENERLRLLLASKDEALSLIYDQLRQLQHRERRRLLDRENEPALLKVQAT